MMQPWQADGTDDWRLSSPVLAVTCVMPELAEVEYYRRQWDCGFGARIVAVRLHPTKRIFRGARSIALKKALSGSVLLSSEAQ